MLDKPHEDPELEFPLTCHFRVIAEDLENIHFVIETVLLELGITAPLEKTNASSGGKYVSFNVTTVVESKERLTFIDGELRNIVGVKMVL